MVMDSPGVLSNFGNCNVLQIRKPLTFAKSLDPAKEILHFSLSVLRRFRQVVGVICKVKANISVCKIGVEQSYKLLFGIELIKPFLHITCRLTLLAPAVLILKHRKDINFKIFPAFMSFFTIQTSQAYHPFAKTSIWGKRETRARKRLRDKPFALKKEPTPFLPLPPSPQLPLFLRLFPCITHKGLFFVLIYPAPANCRNPWLCGR